MSLRGQLDRMNARAATQRVDLFSTSDALTYDGSAITAACTSVRFYKQNDGDGGWQMFRSFLMRLPKATFVGEPLPEASVTRSGKPYKVDQVDDSSMTGEWVLTCRCAV